MERNLTNTACGSQIVVESRRRRKFFVHRSLAIECQSASKRQSTRCQRSGRAKAHGGRLEALIVFPRLDR
jgi:hypothetical protein